jgi:tocopherol O-methyltransferase
VSPLNRDITGKGSIVDDIAKLVPGLSGNNRGVSEYYRNTVGDYFAFWMDRSNPALHFGYHESAGISHLNSLSQANRMLADAVAIAPGERVLDAGCGLGGSSFWLAANRGTEVTGIALGLDQIVWARGEASRRHLSDACTFLVADFLSLPFPDRHFDVVWAQESLCHACDKAAFFQDAYRVLQSGGRIVVADFFLRTESLSNACRVLLEEWLEGWKVPGLWTAAQHANAAKSVGFVDVTLSDVTSRTISSHRRLYNRAIRSLPFAVLMQAAGMRNSMQHGNVISALRQYEALRNNCWFYGILSARK